ncbi:MAG: ATP-binding cassette domain-containing protein, partial [Chloroflexi bacterium]|nr:ATP-binding cassette domain-containing protein [Chloroflexota bacterium]
QIILNVASLSFLGLGFTPPAPEWGAMLNEARPFVERAPWAFLAPGIATFLVVISANYLGDTVRDALDPRVPRIPSFPPLTSYLRFRRSPAANERTARLERIAVLAAGRKADDGSDGQRPIVAAVEHLDVTVLSQQHQSARDPYRSADQPILRSVSLAIREGECVGVVGESGSGKSTLAGVLMGLLRPPLAVTGGTLRLLGEDATGWAWDDWRPVRGRHVALINQDPLNALNPLLKIGDQLGECLRCHHQLPAAEVRRRVAEMLERVRLPASVANEYPHQLSGGMRQRVVIAMALICEPQLVIADEPTTALDVSTQARILDELTELQRSLGVAMIFISHDLRLVARMAERVIVMREGQIVEENTVRALFQTPQHPYTRLLISSIPGASPPMAEKELAGDARS